jgi:hypothetical protein
MVANVGRWHRSGHGRQECQDVARGDLQLNNLFFFLHRLDSKDLDILE